MNGGSWADKIYHAGLLEHERDSIQDYDGAADVGEVFVIRIPSGTLL